MAMACFRLVTFFPLRPDFSFPFFISRISVSTFFPADGEYLRRADFALDFFALDFFLAAFFVAITILLGGQMALVLEQVVYGTALPPACSPEVDALNNASHTRNAYKRIGDEPRCDARERTGDGELEQCRRDPGMQQKSD